MKKIIFFCLLVLVSLLLVAETTRVSVATDGTEAGDNSYDPSISSDGRYVAFYSYDRYLVHNDTNGMPDIFVHDVRTGETTRVSVASDGTQGNMGSYYPSISSDGRYVAFMSWANNLVDNDINGVIDVFVHDRTTGQTTRVSIDSAGNQGDGHSEYPSISSDGRYVAFTSWASNLVDGDTNGNWDVFVHDRQTGQTTRVSVASDGTQGSGRSYSPSISSDGQNVAFTSWASNLVEDDTNWYADIFVHHRLAGQTTRVNVASDGTQSNDYSYSPRISSDGQYVVFESIASNLVADDTNDSYDIFVTKVIGPTYTPPSAIDSYIQDLPDTCFKNNPKQRKNALHNKLMEVQDLIDAGYYQEAIDKLTHDIREKVDGKGKNDWIICSYAQEELIVMIDSLIEYLEGLL